MREKIASVACSAVIIASVIVSAQNLHACSSREAWLKKASHEHPSRKMGFYGTEWAKRALSERLSAAPKGLLEKLAYDNELYGFSERPVAAEPSAEFSSVLKAVEASLPEKVRKLAEKVMIGFFLVRDLAGSGFAESILDENGKESYAVIILDKDVLLGQKANEWATWKERSFFRFPPEPKVDLRLVIEKEEGDTTAGAIRYILLHEIGHCLGMATRAHFSWTSTEGVVSDEYPFAKLAWKQGDGGNPVSLFDDAFPERKSLSPYRFEKSELGEDKVVETYEHLRKTNFPSLSATTAIWEDFAESFAIYIHVVLAVRHYEVRISRPGAPELVIGSCYSEGRCGERKAFMEGWFSNPEK